MDISGKIVNLLPEQNGQGKNGTWRKKEFVIETEAQFPKKVCFSICGEKIDQSPLKEGEKVTVSFDLESREFNGRWYTEAKAWKVQGSGKNNDPAPPDDSFGNEPLPDLAPDVGGLPF